MIFYLTLIAIVSVTSAYLIRQYASHQLDPKRAAERRLRKLAPVSREYVWWNDFHRTHEEAREADRQRRARRA